MKLRFEIERMSFFKSIIRSYEISVEMPEETLYELFFQEHKDKNIGELISIQKFYLQLANIAGEMSPKLLKFQANGITGIGYQLLS